MPAGAGQKDVVQAGLGQIDLGEPHAGLVECAHGVGHCRGAPGQSDGRTVFHRAGHDLAEVDIENDPQAAAFVESVNGGNQTVPTVVFPDGTAVTNPPIGQVKQLLGRA